MDRYFKTLLGIIMIMIIQSYPYMLSNNYYVLGVIGSFILTMLADELRLLIIEHRSKKHYDTYDLDEAIKTLQEPIKTKKKKKTIKRKAEEYVSMMDSEKKIIIPFSKQTK